MGRGKPSEERTKRGFRIQWAIVAITLGLMTAAGGAGLLASPFLEVTNGYENNWLALALLASGLFTANMARMLQIWEKLEPAVSTRPSRRTSSQKQIAEKGFRELFIYVFLAFGGLTALTFASAQPGLLVWERLGLHGTKTTDANIIHMALLVGGLATSLIPLVMGFYLQARAEEEAFDRKVWRRDAISVTSFWASAIVLASIVGLANWATRVSGHESETLAENLTFLITLAVIALFVAFIFLPHLIRYLEAASEKDANSGDLKTNGLNLLTAPAFACSYLDSFLVRLIAPLTGATQKGDGVPHSFVVLCLVPLTALGFVLAPPYGLIPIALGMVMVIALGRRWAWIEEDRETASRLLKTESPEIQVGFDNDLKDEALLGYASLFFLVPLALHQIYGWQPTAFDYEPTTQNDNVLVAWLSFFGAELAKAVPFVDWWEIYQVDLRPPIEASADNPLGKHLTFAARAMVDLVIMAALFQAVAIWQRSRAQKKLYDIGHVNHFEPFAEREFFKQAVGRGSNQLRAEFQKTIRDHVSAREAALGVPNDPYDVQRLAELLKSADESTKIAANWMQDEFGVLLGTPTEKLEQLWKQWQKLVGPKSWPQIALNKSKEARRFILSEKRKLESLLAELESSISLVRKRHVQALLSILIEVKDFPEFEFARLEAIRVLATVRNEYAQLVLIAHVLPAGETEWRQRINNKFGIAPNLLLGQAPMRIKVYDALESYGLNVSVSYSLRKKTADFLHIASVDDGADKACERAARAEERIRNALAQAAMQDKSDVLAGDDDDDDAT